MEKKIYTTPLTLPRSRRRDNWRGLTSVRAGLINPIAFFPLLREDAIRGRLDVQVKMAEAVETIINPIHVKLSAYLVPKSALARFDGSMETLNRSYMKQKLPGGVIDSPPWDVQETLTGDMVDDSGHDLYDILGVHYDNTSTFNTDLVESYNTIINWRRRSVSKALPQVDILSAYPHEAFWDEVNFNYIKASFDAAMMEGAVPVEIDAGQIPLRQYGASSANGTGTGNMNYVNADGSLTVGNLSGAQALHQLAGGPGPFADFGATPGTISLANIALARQTMAFAKMRERYQGIPDEYLISMLMQGIRVPPEDFREPVLLGMARSVIGQQERYATDGASLDQSVTNGIARLSLPFATPAINPGGIVIVTLEIVPARLFERTNDYFMEVKDPEELPNAMEDLLDPQKVEITLNKSIDQFHDTPDGVFGYEPLNAKWNRNHARVGGRFKRPYVDGAFKEERGRIWAIEVENPSLSSDFYLCPYPFPHDVFADTTADPFEIITIGETTISGLTVFGAGFEEDDDHYDKIMAEIDKSRLEGDGTEPAVAEVDESGSVLPGDSADETAGA